MRQLPFAALALLFACADQPRPLPQAQWAHASAVYVQPLSGNAPAEVGDAVKSCIEDDLRASGIRVESRPQGKGELQMLLKYRSDDTFTASLELDGELVDSVSFIAGALPCVGFPRVNAVAAAQAYPADWQTECRCIAREIVARMLESKIVAAALSKRGPTAIAAERADVTAAPASGKHVLAGKLAVLELRNFASDLTHENAEYFTDLLRSAALKAQPQLEVITRENLLVLLQASGKKMEDCEGECEVDTGRRIGADLIVSGEIQKLGSLYKLSLRLHDTHAGRLLASTQASGKSIEELDTSAHQAAEELVAGH